MLPKFYHNRLLKRANWDETRRMARTGKAETVGNGFRVSPWKHRSYNWRVSYFTGHGSNRKRKQKGFQTKKEAVEWAEDQNEKLEAEGIGDHEITKEERRAVMAFREINESLPQAVSKPTLGEVVESYRKKAAVRKRSMNVEELIDLYVKSLKRRKLSQSYLYTIEKRLERFKADHGNWVACDVSSEVAGDWLQELELGATSVNHFRAALSQMFNFALKINIVEENPISVIDKQKEEHSEVGILTPKQAADLLTHSSAEILPAVAIGLFCGLRRSEISRLDWSDLDFAQGHVEVKARNTKSAARRLVKMRKNLKAWLAPHRLKRGPVMPSEMVYRSRLEDASKNAGIKEWPHNALRHSFASYHLAAFGNAPALAGEMGHGSTKMIFQHYRALVTPKVGKEFWSIAPEPGNKVKKLKTA